MSRAPISKSCSIFVGNVPFDADEDELKDVFGEAGHVNSVRVVCDKDTRTPKGYAFVDFAEKPSVQIAIDKLYNVEYKGRKLRVDFAERELNRRGGDDDGDFKGSGKGSKGAGAPAPEPIAVPLPVTTVADRLARIREHEAAEQARVAAMEHAELAELARFVETLTPRQLFHIFGEMQRLSLRAPEVARALVAENTQLCVVLQHAQYLLGLADEPPLPTDPEVRESARNVRQKVFGTAPANPGGSAMPGMPPLPPGMPGAPGLLGFQGFGAPPPPGFANHSAALGQLNAFGGGQNAMAAAMAAAMAQQAAGLTAASAPAAMPSVPSPAAAAPAPAQEEGRQELLEKLSKLAPEQIDKLPHQTKLALLGFLQTLPAQQAAP